MAIGKYYCDYCEKEFQDTPEFRRRHLQGTQHHRAKALWYTHFHTDSCSNQTLVQEPLGKGVCNRFVRTGSCSYGDSCRYIHPKQSSQSLNSPSVPGFVVKGNMGLSLGSLPPSLQPPPDGGYPHLPLLDWG